MTYKFIHTFFETYFAVSHFIAKCSLNRLHESEVRSREADRMSASTLAIHGRISRVVCFLLSRVLVCSVRSTEMKIVKYVFI